MPSTSIERLISSTTTEGRALASVPEELRLEPIEGMARWLGPLLPLALRFVSMIEQRRETMSGPQSPVDGYFRRDRYRHPRVDPGRYRLQVRGVAAPREFTLEELKQLPQEERVLVMECAGNGNHVMGSAGLLGQARWSGPSLETVIAACGGLGHATHLVFRGLDAIPVLRGGYHYGLSAVEVEQARALLALEMNGEPLPRPRGFPIRMVVPGIYSMSHVKWLGTIEGKTQPHDGFYNRKVFVNRERRNGRWETVEARFIGLKSMVTRCLRTPGGWTLTGWAWGGRETIERVEITTDGGQTWQPAVLRPPTAWFGDLPPEDLEHAWSVFDYHWPAPTPGTHRVTSRAFTTEGTAQPMVEDADVHGHFNQTRVKWRQVRVPR